MKELIKNNQVALVLLFLILAVNLIFTNFPLLNLLSYESSVLNAILFSLFSGVYWLKNKDKSSLKTHFGFLFTIVIIPFILLTVSTVLCQGCPLSDGLLFYFIIAIPSIPVGLAIAEFANFLSERFKYLLFVSIWLVVLLGFLPELYYNPQIYFYNPIFGYYPGVIYDQGIEITNSLILYRFINVLFSLAVIYLIRRIYNFKKHWQHIVIIGVILIYISGSKLKASFDFSTDLSRIKDELSSEISTEHFNIIVADSISEREKKILEYEHEFYYKSISTLLETEIDGKITSFIFGTGAQKKNLFGSANADVAKPWLNQIYLNYDNYFNSLKHEISHIFSANYASGLFKIPSNYNPGMIEGFAMAVENNYDDFDIDYLAALAFRNNYKISLKNLFSGFSFFSNTSSISYIYAGSFLKYLAKEYGWENIKIVYNGKSFKKIYKEELTNLEREYYNYLESLEIVENLHSSNYYFGRNALIKRFCARATVKELKLAQSLFIEKDYDNSAELYHKIYNYSGTYSALVGFALSTKELSNVVDAISLVENELPKYEGTSYYYYLEFLLADFYALMNDDNNASYYYNQLIEQNPHKRYLRNAVFKKGLLAQGDSVRIKYMNDEDFKESKIFESVVSSPSNHSLQLITAFKDLDDEEYLIRKEVINEAIANKEYSSYTYFKLSKYAYWFLDIEFSIKFAKLALIKADYKREAIIKEHISKIKWIRDNYLKIQFNNSLYFVSVFY